MLRSFLTIALIACPSALADDLGDLEDELERLYEGQVIVLREPLRGNELAFDSRGQPQGRIEKGTLLADAAVRIQRVRVRGDAIRFSGERLASFTTDSGQQKYTPQHEKVEIRIGIDPKQPRSVLESMTTLLAAPVGTSLQTAFDSSALRDGWEQCEGLNAGLRKVGDTRCAQPDQIPDLVLYRDTLNGEPVYHFTGAIKVPRLEHAPDPLYPENLRREGKQALVVLFAVVGKTGAVENVKVAKSGGVEFDAAAAAAIAKWRFQPAKVNQQPVNFALSVEVNFRLY